MTTDVEKLWHESYVNGWVVLSVKLVLILAFAWAARRAVTRYVHDNDLRYRGRKVVSMATGLLVVLTCLTSLSSGIGGLGLALGAASAGIAFALQEVIASFAGWLGVLFGGFYKVGDRVQLGGIRGDVIDIGVLRTTIMEVGEWVNGDAYNGRIVRVANSFVFKEPVFNYTADFPFLWDEITIPIRYGSDVALAMRLAEDSACSVVGEYTEHAREIWSSMVARYRIEDARLTPIVYAHGTDNWLELTLRYIVDVKSRRRTKTDIWLKVLQKIDEAGGVVELGSATYEIVNQPKAASALPPLSGSS